MMGNNKFSRMLGHGLRLLGIFITLFSVVHVRAATPLGKGYVDFVRRFEASGFETSGAAGLVYVPSTESLWVAPFAGSPAILRVNLLEDLLGTDPLAVTIEDPMNMAFHGPSQSLFLLKSGGLGLDQINFESLEQPAGGKQSKKPIDTQRLGKLQPAGLTFDGYSGQMLILEAAEKMLIRVTPDAVDGFNFGAPNWRGQIEHVRLQGLGNQRVTGLAVHPYSGNIFTFAAGSQKLYELTPSGSLVAERDLSGMGLADLRNMVFAPSGDVTDEARNQNIYLVDAGGGPNASSPGVIELAVDQPAEVILAQTTQRTCLANTIDTSRWNPPSPDPAGLAYNPNTGQLIVTDSEVEEMPLYEGVNGYLSGVGGNLQETFDTTSFTKEPTGLAYNAANGFYYFSDDNQDKIFEVDPGGDGIPGTQDDILRSINTRSFGSNDPEGLAFGNGHIIVGDGVNGEVYILDAGQNGVFQGILAGGDDSVTHFDTAALGVKDAEAVEFNQAAGTIFVTGPDNNNNVIETSENGSLVADYDVSAAMLEAPAGLAKAPASQGGGMNLFIADRAIDNNSNASENDGKISEMTFDPTACPAVSNLLKNGGFELDGNGDGKPDSWSQSSSFTRSNLDSYQGSYAGRHFSTSNTGYTVKQIITGINGGASYSFSGWVNIPNTSDAFRMQIQIRWEDASRNVIRTDTVATLTSATGGWVETAQVLTAPVNATRVMIRMNLKSLNGNIFVDDFVFKP